MIPQPISYTKLQACPYKTKTKTYGRISFIRENKSHWQLHLRNNSVTSIEGADLTVVVNKGLIKEFNNPSIGDILYIKGLVGTGKNDQRYIETTSIINHVPISRKIVISPNDITTPSILQPKERLYNKYYQSLVYLYHQIKITLEQTLNSMGVLGLRIIGNNPYKSSLTQRMMTQKLLTHTYSLSQLFYSGKIDRHHLKMFNQCQIELVFTDNCTLMFFEEKMFKKLILSLTSHCGVVNRLQKTIKTNISQGLIYRPFGRITYASAVRLLQKAVKNRSAYFSSKPSWGKDLSLEQYKWLAQKFGRPVFVFNYPRILCPDKPNLKSNDETAGNLKLIDEKVDNLKSNDETVDNLKLIVPGLGPLTNGGVYRNSPTSIAKEIKLNDLNSDQYNVNQASTETAGFSFSLERLLMFLTRDEDIKNVLTLN